MRGRAQKACTAARIQIGFRRERDIAAHCDRPARKARANRGLQPWWLMRATAHGRYAVCSSKPHSYPRRTGPTCSHGRSSRQAPGSSTRATEGAGRVVRPRAAAVDAQACTELSKPDLHRWSRLDKDICRNCSAVGQQHLQSRWMWDLCLFSGKPCHMGARLPACSLRATPPRTPWLRGRQGRQALPRSAGMPKSP